MIEPTPRASRLAVASAAAAIIVLGGGGFLLGRATVPEPRPTAIPAPTVERVDKPEVPEKPVVHDLGRADIIALANAAADAASGGTAAPENVSAAVGQRFEVYMPFGCDGPAPAGGNAPQRWRYDAATSSLRISIKSVSWDPDEWLGRTDQLSTTEQKRGESEALEGFWISRPWSSQDTCKPGNAQAGIAGADAVTLPGETLGLAQIFTENDSRNARRAGKPYESVIRTDLKSLDIGRGLRVRLEGRVARFPDGATTRCKQPAGPEQRPICLIAVTFDEVAVENPATSKTLATWSAAGLNRR